MGKLHPNTAIPTLTGITVGDFWSWAYSDVLNNRNRAIYAEFLVGLALDALNKPRIEWDGYDLLYLDRKIEVKAAGFLQSWQQDHLSEIRFDIAAKQAWNAATNTYLDSPVRSSDCYVFCLHHETDLAKVDVLNVDQWEFYVVDTDRINQQFGQQKSVGLNPLKKLEDQTHYIDLKQTVDRVLGIAR